jgi:protein-tyrosine phosphatase
VTPEIVDLHSHLVPGVDDGARHLAEALDALGKLVAAGASAVLTTPHIDATLILREGAFERDHAAVEAAWATVVGEARARFPSVALHLGREVMLDTAVPRLEDPRVRLNGGRYVLVEFPRLTIPPASEDVLYRIRAAGFVPVLAHVERYAYHGAEEHVLDEWRATGCVFQVNTPSLLGGYGRTAQSLAWRLLERGWADLLASDFHARGSPSIGEARAALEERGGTEQMELLMAENPRRIVADRELEGVPPLAPPPPARGPWARLRGALHRRT